MAVASFLGAAVIKILLLGIIALHRGARLSRMRVLAVDTSTMAGGVALLEAERVVGESLLDVRTTHSERLMVAVERALGDAGWMPQSLDGLAVAVGPGSFTGLRIGLATVKGLALALGCPIAAVPTLDAMAAGLPWASRPVCPVLVARKDEVFACLYRWDGATMQREWDYVALSPAALAARLTEPVVGVGDGAALVASPWMALAQPVRRGPSAAAVGWLGQERLRRGDTVGAAELAPLYLRPSEAELKRRVVAVH
jgi:tRNA threonylcarbamoyladenosine biosynthesis protein TsaB